MIAISPHPAEVNRRIVWRTWFMTVTLAEVAGFAVPATAGVLSVEWPSSMMFALLVVAGGVEGTILGYWQAHVFQRVINAFPSRAWVAATAAGAALAWSLGLLPVLLADQLEGAAVPVQAGFAVTVFAGTLMVLSVSQWLVLRRVSRRASEWIVGSVAAWCAGLLAFGALTTPLWHEGQQPIVTITIGLVGGLVMAATMSAITGSVLVRILYPRSGINPNDK